MQDKSDLNNLDAPGVGAMSVDQFCRWACIGKTKAYAEAKAKRLQFRKIGSKTIVTLQEAQRWLQSLPTAAA